MEMSITNDVYMIAYKFKNASDIHWYCTGRGNKPFVTFNLSSAKREATKLRNFGYEASIITASVKKSTCFLDLKTL